MSAVLDRVDVVAPAPVHPRVVARPRPRNERLAVGLGLLLVGVMHSVNLAGWPQYWDDEGTYYSQAWSVQHLGSLSPYTYWYDHPPVGWLQLALVSWLPDAVLDGSTSAVLAGRVVMVVCTLATALLTYLLAKRLGLTRGWALLAMLFWAVDPLVLYEGRQVLLDNVALPWLLGAFVLALSRERHLGSHMAAGLCFGMAVLSKETTLMFAPALLVALWQSAYRPTRAFSVMGMSLLVAAMGSMYLLFALVRSELFPGPGHVSLWDAVSFQFLEREGSGWILDPDSPEGGAYDTFHSWLQHDGGVLLLGGVGAALPALFVRRLRPVALAVLIAAAVALRPSGYLPHMYPVAVLPFCALACVGLLDVVGRWVMRRRDVALRAGLGTVVAALLIGGVMQLGDWRYNYEAAWTEDTNDVHATTVEYVAGALPRDAVVVADNSYWNDLVDAGWSVEDAVWFYKADADAAVADRLGGDYRGIDYLVWSIDVAENALPVVAEAHEHSELLWAQGEGRSRVEVRRVLTPAEEARIEAEEDARVAAELEAELRRVDAFMAEDSLEWPDLTNGQVTAIRQERDTLSVPALAAKYETSEETVGAVLAGG
ncbi:hypothetical protein GCM10027451_33430 [Geodermatophilus aquaeductus]|uniref:Dolichyl-phosphate-mannose-protein mannosyltransferase n=1 Tax=Geodermatophilus aquaeductus TaxID=1564161 RepID=A0A521EWW1_9ACTN|nr:glycosyltransferase family 39 protein [Geodermatophilus aquaeductus]SMO88405.1 Dolichyl-phosphate-mannose-protein mannosyltransferase [Geodermatophilus aquaeductus]